MFKIDLNQITKEGGNKSMQYLLAQAVDMEKNPREGHFQDILRIKQSDPKAFEEWLNAMKAEIQALNDRQVWELVELPQDRKPIKCRCYDR